MNRMILFRRLIIRPLFRDRLRSMLSVAAITLGVSVVIAIDLAGNAAAGSFHSSMETLGGKATFEIDAPGGLPEDTLGRLAAIQLPLSLDPRVQEYVGEPHSGLTLPLIGVDVISLGERGGFLGRDFSAASLDEPNAAWVGADLGVKPGANLPIVVQDRLETLHVVGLLPKSDTDLEPNRAIVVDLPEAQQLTHRTGRIDRIRVTVPDSLLARSGQQTVRRAIEAVLPPGAELREAGANTEANRKMLDAFRWNLRILSAIGLIVGAFLIYNSVSVSVARRRGEIGILRALGATQTAVRTLFLAEAAVLGLLGGGLGAVLGRLLAQSAVGALATTVNTLYVISTPSAIFLDWEHIALSVALGLAVSLVAAYAPATEAGRIAPVEAMARGTGEYRFRLTSAHTTAAGAFLLVLGAAASQLPPIDGRPVFGYLSTLLLILGMALLSPSLVLLFGYSTRTYTRRLLGVEGMLASRSLVGSLRRSSVLLAAVATAVAMITSVAIMVGSFRETVVAWMDTQLTADIYIRAAAPASPGTFPLMDAHIADEVRALPEVASVDRYRRMTINVGGLPAIFGFSDSSAMLHEGRMRFLPGENREAILRQLPTGPYVVVSEPFSRKHGFSPGDRFSLPLPGGPMMVTVLGVYVDYSNERGTVYGDRRVFGERFPEALVSNIGVTLKPGIPVAQGENAIERLLAGRQVLVTANQTLRQHAMRIFDQTFAITWALEAVAIFVAVMGMAGALVALVIDRRRELSVLRFLGASTAQIRSLVYFEAGLLGLLSNVVGLVLGFALSLILIYVINRQSFGWTFQFHWPGRLLLGALTLVYAATLASAWYPGRLAARLNPIEVIHEE
ncbi:MAG: ABC transporter permease [Bryobacterales bacterium]|nr:ABC transporter permease [Bryobacterales bacterium]